MEKTGADFTDTFRLLGDITLSDKVSEVQILEKLV